MRILKKISVATVVVLVLSGAVWLFLVFSEPESVESFEKGTGLTGPANETNFSSHQSALVTSSGAERSSELAIEFFDGESIPISFNRPPKFPELPMDSFGFYYDEWRARALAGDGDFAFLLHHMLASCRASVRSKEELDNAIDQLYQTHTLRVGGEDSDVVVSMESKKLGVVEQSLYDSYERCKDMSDQQLGDETNWLRIAANNGSAHAARRLGQELLATDIDEAISYLEMAWLSGDLDALSELAFISLNGRPESSDPVLAYAYWSLYNMISSTLIEAGGRSLHAPASNEEASLYESQLLPDQKTESIIIAKELLLSNPNCCFSRNIR